MKDRQAPRFLPKNRGVSYDQKLHPRQGVPILPKGVPPTGITEFGIPSHNYVLKKKEPAKKHCKGIEGPCKAWPVKGDPEGLCAGHRRQFDKIRADSADTDDDSPGVE